MELRLAASRLLDRRPQRGHLEGLILTILLKVLTFRDGILELLLHLGNSGLMLLAGGLHRCQFGDRLFGCRLLLCSLLLGLPQLGFKGFDLSSDSYSNANCTQSRLNSRKNSLHTRLF